MGYSYGAACKNCGMKFEVNEGSGMSAMPFHCDRCGQEWSWEFGPGDPMGKLPNPPACACGGSFTVEASPRCPSCRSTELDKDPDGTSILYD
jgi:predicted Zn-ribbon and HTH transcriptional regulator